MDTTDSSDPITGAASYIAAIRAFIIARWHGNGNRQERMIDNEEEEGKGRSAKRPRERLKFQIFPTVVALLSLEQWRNAHGANRPDARRVSNFFQWTREACHRFRCLGDSVELVCKPKEVAVCPDRFDITPPSKHTIGLDEYVLSVYFIRTYFLLAWINSFGTCTVLIARDREASLVHSD